MSANNTLRRLNWKHFIELKRRWRISLAALVRRARDLGCLSDASYRRANINLRGRLSHLEADTEPPAELPRNVPAALEAIADEWPLAKVAAELRLGTSNLHALLSPYGVSE